MSKGRAWILGDNVIDDIAPRRELHNEASDGVLVRRLSLKLLHSC